MIKNLIFDFGNVVVRFDPDYMTGCITKKDDEFTVLRDVVFNPKTFEQTDKGEITADEHKAIVCADLPVSLHKKQIFNFHTPKAFTKRSNITL